jgi:hypothetical protein
MWDADDHHGFSDSGLGTGGLGLGGSHRHTPYGHDRLHYHRGTQTRWLTDGELTEWSTLASYHHPLWQLERRWHWATVSDYRRGPEIGLFFATRYALLAAAVLTGTGRLISDSEGAVRCPGFTVIMRSSQVLASVESDTLR